jgi:protein phosphatase 1 regulatory subunit 42
MSNTKRENTLVLKLLFSGFSYPQESRFVKIFVSQKTKPKQTLSVNKLKKKSLNIETINITNGKDKRTTIIIKNLPNNISKDELKSIIEPLGNINFIYIPLLIKNKNKLNNNSPCAYINVINYKTILKIVQKFEQLKILNSSDKDFSKVEIFYSGTQGKHALINRFSLEKKYLPPNQAISFS